MIEEELRALPVLLTVPQAAHVLGVGRTVAYQLVRRGEWPTPVIRVGAQIRIPRMPLLDLLGLSPIRLQPPPPQGPASTIGRRRLYGKGHDGRDHVQEMLLP